MGDGLEGRVTSLEREVLDIRLTCKDTNERLIRMEESLKTSKDKILDLEKNTQAIMEMSSSLRVLTDRVTEVLSKIDKQEVRLDNLEYAPGKLAMKGWTVVLTTVGTTIIGLVLGMLIKGGM